MPVLKIDAILWLSPEGVPRKSLTQSPGREPFLPEARRRRLQQTTRSVRFRPLHTRVLSCPATGDNDEKRKCKPRATIAMVQLSYIGYAYTPIPERAFKHVLVFYNRSNFYVTKQGGNSEAYYRRPCRRTGPL